MHWKRLTLCMFHGEMRRERWWWWYSVRLCTSICHFWNDRQLIRPSVAPWIDETRWLHTVAMLCVRKNDIKGLKKEIDRKRIKYPEKKRERRRDKIRQTGNWWCIFRWLCVCVCVCCDAIGAKHIQLQKKERRFSSSNCTEGAPSWSADRWMSYKRREKRFSARLQSSRERQKWMILTAHRDRLQSHR